MNPGSHPARLGAGGVRRFTVLYDAGCGLCRTARRWLEGRAQLVPLVFVAAGSPEARQLLPELDQDATLRDITVVSDAGAVYVGDGAWLACLWALDGYREMAYRLASPALLPLARTVVAGAAAVRARTAGAGSGYRGCDDREACAR